MRAVTWQGNEKMEVKTVPDPTIEEPTDMIVRITATAICGSDLHLYHNGKPVMEEDYVVGHEPMGIVEEVGSAVTKVKKGDRVEVNPITWTKKKCPESYWVFLCLNIQMNLN
ncbi:alcohol dehydrogenase catalytic domain-containing protein [Leuconostoc falkenbergense]|uniref:Alcohol dehydrogenase catalytic domain-containing protein n=1 Tax=Leuconostoc falkenbergense TaxID=2766470 RepID=A0ABT7S1V2_9LACO|nr:alcohol dehydrogenase catalytic domain-containing protein [Leuconostoc falkenbergense]MDM7647556.1 alcohol dehydrogenase catalytic domain-containing protein [Leuconostoc falkenbergense]